ncbi:MAG: phage tail protein [Melioribacteraceae bacterium]|nr:MAG: phage tail protein [Melioribacteraceae bacterium]
MASAEPYMASVDLWAGTYAPRGWAFCQGQLLSIAQFSAIFSLIGNVYGGDGRTTFGLPDLRGRVPVGAGQSPGTSFYNLGQKGGTETVTLLTTQMPTHNHGATLVAPGYTGSVAPGAFNGRGGTPSNDPINNYPAPATSGTNIYNSTSTGAMGSSPVTVTLNPTSPGSVTIGNNGGSQPHDNMQPYTCLNYIFCLDGLFPPRD